MKKIFLVIGLLIGIGANGQNKTSVSVIASGQGANKEEAKNKALRSC
jgi:hypothetical protein